MHLHVSLYLFLYSLASKIPHSFRMDKKHDTTLLTRKQNIYHINSSFFRRWWNHYFISKQLILVIQIHIWVANEISLSTCVMDMFDNLVILIKLYLIVVR